MKNTIQNIVKTTSLSFDEYKEEYNRSINDSESFWEEKANTLDWIKRFSKVKESKFSDPVEIKWFSDGSLNVAYNCLDRHLKEREIGRAHV